MTYIARMTIQAKTGFDVIIAQILRRSVLLFDMSVWCSYANRFYSFFLTFIIYGCQPANTYSKLSLLYMHLLTIISKYYCIFTYFINYSTIHKLSYNCWSDCWNVRHFFFSSVLAKFWWNFWRGFLSYCIHSLICWYAKLQQMFLLIFEFVD